MTWVSHPDACPHCEHPRNRHKLGGQCLDCDPSTTRVCMQPVQSGKPYKLPKDATFSLPDGPIPQEWVDAVARVDGAGAPHSGSLVSLTNTRKGQP